MAGGAGGMNKVAPEPVVQAAVAPDEDIPQAVPVVQEMSHDAGPGVQPGQQILTYSVKVGGLAALEGRNTFKIIQRRDHLEAICPACEFSNHYDIFDEASSEPVLMAKEKSDCLGRTCCRPGHEADLHFYDARVGVPPDTLVFKAHKPFKLINCFGCANVCNAEVITTNENDELLGTAKEKPTFFTPTLEIMDRNESPYAEVVGPTCCIGGLNELCNDTVFSLQKPDTHEPFGQIIKRRPTDCCDYISQAVTDGDDFSVQVPADTTLENRANFLASALLIDYMFFEHGGLIKRTHEGTECNLCNLYCFGCLCPCTMKIGGSNN